MSGRVIGSQPGKGFSVPQLLRAQAPCSPTSLELSLTSYQAVLTSSLPAAACFDCSTDLFLYHPLCSSSQPLGAPSPASNSPRILGQPSRLLSPLCELAIPSLATTTWGITSSWLPAASASTCPWKPHKCQWLLSGWHGPSEHHPNMALMLP